MIRKQIAALIVMLVLGVGLMASVNEFLNEININPNPMTKNTTVFVSFLQTVRADVIIETEDGTLVKTLFTGLLEPGNYEFYWNRLSDGGEYAPAGRYFVTVIYEARYTSTKKTLILK